jgi:iron-sulfur cluster assembly protein
MIILTEDAQKAIKENFEIETDKEIFLKVFVEGGGCCGFNYGMVFVSAPEEDDIAFKNGDITVLTDEFSLPHLNNAVIEYAENEFGGSFKIDNPNTTGGCGCGKSFSTDSEEENTGCCGGSCSC